MMKKIIDILKAYLQKKSLLKIVLLTIGVVAFMVAVVSLPILLIMHLWNSIIVNLFNVPTLNFWTTLGLYMLCSLLFKSKDKIKSKKGE